MYVDVWCMFRRTVTNVLCVNEKLNRCHGNTTRDVTEKIEIVVTLPVFALCLAKVVNVSICLSN